ncbi:MAG: hypothetical protein HOK80_10240 [Candidatus Cloacimonetes bacterium]|jgi:hypothetical protein|nr:hypothetical protein [Candidatus Cloacimonadota bacterium]MBT5421257.1 hypothetical protein [Candidatus Cloacimonadota bacterium]
MNWKIIVIAALLIASIFCHYSNKHKLIINGRKLDESRELYQAYMVNNLDLITLNSKLSSRDRIQRLASDNLNMFFPADNESVHNIKFDNKKETFRLIDYIVPSAEALTR